MSEERMNPNFNLESCLRNKVNEAKRYLEDKHKRQKDGGCEESSYAESFIYYFQNVETLLDLYQQEKEKNQKLSKELTVNICNGIEVKVFEEMRTELKQEKEKNKKLQIRCKELIKEKQELNTALLYDNISKNKIREFIKKETFEGTYSFDLISAKRLQELLEEN